MGQVLVDYCGGLCVYLVLCLVHDAVGALAQLLDAVVLVHFGSEVGEANNSKKKKKKKKKGK